MEVIQYKPIGIIHSPFKTPDETPLQTRVSNGARGKIELFPEYTIGLEDLYKFSHITLVYHFHLIEHPELMVKPNHSDSCHGVFATRAPGRPNSIGISVIRLVEICGNILYVENIDVIDGTPLLDIKPFIPILERQYATNLGWLADEFDES
jgi:tRNA-Thr(GGU) m(6)t(6)A37 methyltransferase TsaA